MSTDEVSSMDEPQKRLTAVHSRYHVGCGSCGFIEAFRDLMTAVKECQRHYHDKDETTVFDSMAHRGQVDMWHWDGRIFHKQRRPQR